MQVKNSIKWCFAGISACLVYVFAFGLLRQVNFVNTAVEMVLEVKNPSNNQFQVFYDVPKFEFSTQKEIKGSMEFQEVTFTFPTDSFGIIRIDPGTFSSEIILRKIIFAGSLSSYTYDADSIFAHIKPANQISTYELTDEGVKIVTLGNDPFLVSERDFKDVFEKFQREKHQLKKLPFLLAALVTIVWIVLFHYFSPVIISRLYFNKLHTVWITGFLLLILVPVLYNLMQEKLLLRDEEEKRNLAPFPEFSFLRLAHWPKEYTAYYHDHFGFRKPLIALQNYTKYAVFHTSAKPDEVIVGKDGWMFGALNFMKEDFQHKASFSPQDLQKIKDNLTEKFHYFQTKGIRYYLFIPPAKGEIYPEYMPAYIQKESEYSKLDQVLQYLQGDTLIHIIDCRNELREKKKEEQVFYKKDTHWNYIGAFVGYKKMMEAVAKDFPAVKPFEMEDFDRVLIRDKKQNLAEMLSLGPYLEEKADFLWLKKGYQAEEIVVHGQVFPFINTVSFYEMPDKNLPRAIIHHDSYTLSYKDYLSENFSRTTYLWTNIMFPYIYEAEKPDLVIQELAESSIRYLITENPVEMKPLP